MKQVNIGDLLFHGDAATEKQLGVKLSKTGMACAMCHPFASDTHPHEFPKYQEQMNEFATLRDMINWCIEKPNEGEKIDPNSEAHEGARGLHLLVEPQLQARPGKALSTVEVMVLASPGPANTAARRRRGGASAPATGYTLHAARRQRENTWPARHQPRTRSRTSTR